MGMMHYMKGFKEQLNHLEEQQLWQEATLAETPLPLKGPWE